MLLLVYDLMCTCDDMYLCCSSYTMLVVCCVQEAT
jgi:hypothetical protein